MEEGTNGIDGDCMSGAAGESIISSQMQSTMQQNSNGYDEDEDGGASNNNLEQQQLNGDNQGKKSSNSNSKKRQRTVDDGSDSDGNSCPDDGGTSNQTSSKKRHQVIDFSCYANNNDDGGLNNDNNDDGADDNPSTRHQHEKKRRKRSKEEADNHSLDGVSNSEEEMDATTSSSSSSNVDSSMAPKRKHHPMNSSNSLSKAVTTKSKLKPKLQIGSTVYAAWWPDTERRKASSWYEGRIRSIKVKYDTNNDNDGDTYGPTYYYDIDYVDGDELDGVADQFVFVKEDYLLNIQKKDDWLGVVNVMDKGCKDVWARMVGWYEVTIDGVVYKFSLLSDALRAYDDSVVRQKGTRTRTSDLNLPEEWEGLLTGEDDDSSDIDMADLVPRPRGRPKKGCEWDALLGVWVEDSPKAKAKDSAEADVHELDKNMLELGDSAGSPKDRAKRKAAWPLTDITEPGPHDCLFGRGGGTLVHPGNIRFRKMVDSKKEKYVSSQRSDKQLVVMEIIDEWRSLDPPGRFLKQDDETNYWNDVGDEKACKKTSQALSDAVREMTRGRNQTDEEEVPSSYLI